MIRLVVFVLILFAAAAGFAWLADRPGAVAVDWMGYRIETDLTVALVALVVGVLLIMFTWWLVRGLWNAPGSIGDWFGRRRREKGWSALSRGMIAVGAGDPRVAGKLSTEARKILGDEPLALLLEAQAAQLGGDRAGARVAFERMLKAPETRLLGLRGLYVEAQRHGEPEAARHFAEEAVKEAPALAWAGGAILEADARMGQWDKALEALDRNARHKLVDKKVAKRHRAVLLTARALELEDHEPEKAKGMALEAHGLAPELVPAAVVAARLHGRAGDVKKAAKILEKTWLIEPHPELADAYAHARTGDSVLDRLRRVQDLVKLRNYHPEGALALAQAALVANDFTLARTTLKGLITTTPTRRACLLMAELEDAEHGDRGRVREWLARALKAPRDPAWVADGYIADHWSPVSPVSGRLDAFEWKVPPEDLVVPVTDLIDDAREAFEESGSLIPLEAPPAPAATTPLVIEAPAAVEPTPAPAPQASAPEPVPAPEPVSTPAVTPAPQPANDPGPAPRAAQVPGAARAAVGEADAKVEGKTVAFPLTTPPDDPGPDGAETLPDKQPKRFRLF